MKEFVARDLGPLEIDIGEVKIRSGTKINLASPFAVCLPEAATTSYKRSLVLRFEASETARQVLLQPLVALDVFAILFGNQAYIDFYLCREIAVP